MVSDPHRDRLIQFFFIDKGFILNLHADLSLSCQSSRKLIGEQLKCLCLKVLFTFRYILFKPRLEQKRDGFSVLEHIHQQTFRRLNGQN